MSKPSNSEIERTIIRLIEENLPAKQEEAALAWLKVRVEVFKSLKRLG